MLRPNFKIYQAAFADLGTPEQIAEAWKGYDVVCLTHGRTVSQPNGCLDARYDGMTQLIQGLRARNKDQLIFGYVPVTADAPVGSGCGYTVPYGVQPWEPPNGIATRFVEWCQTWIPEGIDGIFIDLFASHFCSAAMRDNALSYVRHLGLLAMVNVTHPTAYNVKWAVDCQFIAPGDFILMEGFLSSDGDNTEAISIAAMAELRKWPGLLAAPLVTTKAGLPVTDAQRRNLMHRMGSFVRPGDALALAPSTLGGL